MSALETDRINEVSQSDIGELVSLIAHASPQKLETLRIQYPESRDILMPGAVLGNEAEISSADLQGNLACDVATEALTVYSAAASNLSVRLRSRLAWSWRFDLAAKIAAAAGSGGAVGIFATGIGMDKGIIAAITALIGSVCALYVSYLQKDATAGSVVVAYNKLIEGLVEAEQLRRSLRLLCPAGPSQELARALARSNEVARALNELALRYN